MTKIVVDPKTSKTRGTKQPFRCLDVLNLETVAKDKLKEQICIFSVVAKNQY